MYQITDGAFARRGASASIDHVVVEEGPWHAWRSCWFNSLYFRVIPSHAVELTSASLDRGVARVLARRGIESATREQKQELAALDPSLRRRRRRRLRAPRPSAEEGPALRRPLCPRVSGTRCCDAAGVRPIGGARVVHACEEKASPTSEGHSPGFHARATDRVGSCKAIVAPPRSGIPRLSQSPLREDDAIGRGLAAAKFSEDDRSLDDPALLSLADGCEELRALLPG